MDLCKALFEPQSSHVKWCKKNSFPVCFTGCLEGTESLTTNGKVAYKTLEGDPDIVDDYLLEMTGGALYRPKCWDGSSGAAHITISKQQQ